MKKKQILILCVIFICIILLFNFLNIFGTAWFKHPDEHGTYIVIKEFYKYGDMSKALEEIGTYVSTPSGLISQNNIVFPNKPVMEYYIYTIAYQLDDSVFFYVVPVLTLISLFLIIFTLRLVYKDTSSFDLIIYVGLLSTSFFFVYWSNQPYFNLIASIFFISGIVLLISMEDSKRYFSTILIAFAVMLRYEFLLFFVLFLFLTCIFYFKFLRKNLLLIFIIVLLCVPVLIFNMRYYNNPLESSYFDNYDVQSINSNNIFEKIYLRYFTQDFHPDVPRLLNNFEDWVIKFMFWIVPLSLLGVVYFFRKNNNNKAIFYIFLLIIIIYWSYNVLGGYHWGENKNFVGTVYIRYMSFAILYALLLSFAFFDFLKSHKKSTGFLIFIVIVNCFLLSFSSPPDDLPSIIKYNVLYSNLNQQIVESPDSLVITAFYGKYLTTSNVLNVDTNPIKSNYSTFVELNSLYPIISKYTSIIIFDELRDPYISIATFLKSNGYYEQKRIILKHESLSLSLVVYAR